MDRKRALIIILLLFIAMMALGIFMLNEQLLVTQSSVDRLEKTLKQKEKKLQNVLAKFQEQNRTLQTLQSEKIRAEAYIEQLSKELEGAMQPLQAPTKSKTQSKENNRSRGIRG